MNLRISHVLALWLLSTVFALAVSIQEPDIEAPQEPEITIDAAFISYNIDFGNEYGAPANSYAAAGPYSGVWNDITTTGTHSLINLNGVIVGPSMTLTAGTINGNITDFGGDAGDLLADNFYSNTWSVTFSNLFPTSYDIYYYAPAHPSVSTGAFTVTADNTYTATSLNGSSDATLTLNTDYGVFSNVSTSDGTITISGNTNLTGLAGLQVVAIPEPSTYALMGLGALIVGYFIYRRKRA